MIWRKPMSTSSQGDICLFWLFLAFFASFRWICFINYFYKWPIRWMSNRVTWTMCVSCAKHNHYCYVHILQKSSINCLLLLNNSRAGVAAETENSQEGGEPTSAYNTPTTPKKQLMNWSICKTDRRSKRAGIRAMPHWSFIHRKKTLVTNSWQIERSLLLLNTE